MFSSYVTTEQLTINETAQGYQLIFNGVQNTDLTIVWFYKSPSPSNPSPTWFIIQLEKRVNRFSFWSIAWTHRSLNDRYAVFNYIYFSLFRCDHFFPLYFFFFIQFFFCLSILCLFWFLCYHFFLFVMYICHVPCSAFILLMQAFQRDGDVNLSTHITVNFGQVSPSNPVSGLHCISLHVSH